MDKLLPRNGITLNSHKHPPYHLRLNKAIDRLLFMDIIKAFGICYNIQKQNYQYIGFGGPYLEDFKLLSSIFPKMKLTSVEMDWDTHKRQIFHKCSKNITLFEGTFDKFLDETELFESHPIIIWLDYTGNGIKLFREIETLCKKVRNNSLIRITLNADEKRLKEDIKDDFQRIYEDYLPATFNPINLISPVSFCNIIYEMTKKALLEGLDSTGLFFVPLHIARYRDGQQMVSVTGVICDDLSKFPWDKMTALCPNINKSENINIIDIPTLTLKERLKLERFLPNSQNDGKAIIKKLGYMIANTRDENLRKLEQYEKYYRYYPHFNKIIP